MWQYNGQTIREGRPWVTDAGIQQSPQWHIWSPDEKKTAGLIEVTPETPPDSRLYNWTQNPDGTINKTALPINDVKSNLKEEVKRQQGSFLSETDWTIIRKADAGTSVPSDIQTWRDAIREKATVMESAIDGAADTDAIAALFVTWDKSGNKSGVLYDWPELESQELVRSMGHGNS